MRKLKITLKCGKDLFRGPEPTKEEFKVLRNKMEELFEDLTALKEARNNLKKEVWEEKSDKTTLKEHNEEYPSYNEKKNEIKHQEKD